MTKVEATNEEQTRGDSRRRVYELGYHIVPAATDDELAQVVSSIKELAVELGGTPISGEDPTHVTLAYTMIRSRGGKREKFASTHFGWMKFELDSGETTQLKERLDANDSVLRYLLIETVREDTRAPKRVTDPAPKPSEPIRPKLTDDVPKKKAADEKKKSVSDEDLDKTIEELVVE